MFPRTSIASGMTLAALMAVVGCNNNQLRPPVEPRADPYGGKQVYVDSYELQRDIAVGTPIRSRDQAGLMHVVVPVRSVVDLQLHVQYRVRFFDRNRNIVSEQGWTDKTLTANTPDQVDANSTSPAAEDFQVDFRYPPGF